ncbi:hypothetical protein FSC37_04860 [Piscinibacter aquaticus]|uniref:Uncharacterized protein n=1 Tax=Piscinibacter aquaticus TaxID=392597 RepID=A0A5C6TYG3_9BURK|nr:hypothetical protein FSC37_04860 [Piscinibacter aquaticus]
MMRLRPPTRRRLLPVLAAALLWLQALGLWHHVVHGSGVQRDAAVASATGHGHDHDHAFAGHDEGDPSAGSTTSSRTPTSPSAAPARRRRWTWSAQRSRRYRPAGSRRRPPASSLAARLSRPEVLRSRMAPSAGPMAPGAHSRRPTSP